MKKNIKGATYSFKGGPGKSFVSFELCSSYDWFCVELDPYGNLASRLNKVEENSAISIGLHEKITLPQDKNIIIDCGGFDDPRLKQLFKNEIDFVMVPYVPSVESVQTTVLALQKLKEYAPDIPIIIIANMILRHSKSTEKLKEVIVKKARQINNSCLYHEIFDLASYRTSINQNKSIVEMAKKRKCYQKASKAIESLQEKIESLII